MGRKSDWSIEMLLKCSVYHLTTESAMICIRTKICKPPRHIHTTNIKSYWHSFEFMTFGSVRRSEQKGCFWIWFLFELNISVFSDEKQFTFHFSDIFIQNISNINLQNPKAFCMRFFKHHCGYNSINGWYVLLVTNRLGLYVWWVLFRR